ncbi:glyoxalase/bleomycin resistance/dioxygenase family protein [Nocardia iowensis]|uniref:glyoxalase/bleomycin resistance/dioxygenase family protein n=1 Tax=Nocardia iowensis TaxID=204891 RepID=UPI001FE845EB|nr:glyoxalase/bleomycin resistance/dioxygenase family protein [Nocardia iowensis]
MSAAPAFADVRRGNPRLLLSGPTDAGWHQTDVRWMEPHPLVVADISAEVDRLRAVGLTFRNDIVSGPGGQQILLEDPSATSSNCSNLRGDSSRRLNRTKQFD